jgi:GntR family transcriptional regulator, trigonelline degradation regulator
VRELSRAEAEDLYQIRAVLEGLAARLFVQHASAEQVEQLEQSLAVVVEAYDSGDAARVLDTKNRF